MVAGVEIHDRWRGERETNDGDSGGNRGDAVVGQCETRK